MRSKVTRRALSASRSIIAALALGVYLLGILGFLCGFSASLAQNGCQCAKDLKGAGNCCCAKRQVAPFQASGSCCQKKQVQKERVQKDNMQGIKRLSLASASPRASCCANKKAVVSSHATQQSSDGTKATQTRSTREQTRSTPDTVLISDCTCGGAVVGGQMLNRAPHVLSVLVVQSCPTHDEFLPVVAIPTSIFASSPDTPPPRNSLA